MKKLLVLAATLPLFAAHAQAQQSTPREQALTNRLINEINNGLACQTDTIALREQVTKLQADLKAATEGAAKKQDRAPEKK